MRLNEPDRLGKTIDELLRRVALLENALRSGVAVLASDPVFPKDGDAWLRTSDGVFRLRSAGATRNVTTAPDAFPDTGWLSPTYANGWVDFGSPGSAYRRIAGLVVVRGLVKSGTLNSTIFTLPVGFRPGAFLIFPSSSGQTFSETRLLTDGTLSQSGGSTNGYHAINITFVAEA